MAESLHLNADDIHPTFLGSVVRWRTKKRPKWGKWVPFEGAIMRHLGMYDVESGNSISGTLVFIPDGTPKPIRFRARVEAVKLVPVYVGTTDLGTVTLRCTNPRNASDVEALRGKTVLVELTPDEPGEGGD